MTNVIRLKRYRKARRDRVRCPADDLSFMKRCKPRGSGIDYWCVEPSGEYSADCERARELAIEYLIYIGLQPTFGNVTLLGCIVNDMAKRVDGGRLSGVEIGFLANVNRAAMSAAAFYASGGAVIKPVLTRPQAIERSYQLSALLGVCEIAARYLAEPSNPDNVSQVGSNIANVLELANEILGEIHDSMERAEMQERKAA